MNMTFGKSALTAFCFALSLSALNASNTTPTDDQMVILLFEESKKDTGNDSRWNQITEFALQKAKDMAARNPDFAEDVMFDDDFASLQPIILDDDNVLLILSTCLHAYQTSGCLFLINKDKTDWTPLNFKGSTGEKLINSYSVVTSSIGYDAPILSIYSRGAGFFAGIGDDKSYVFRDGTFQHIRSYDHRLDDKKLEDDEKLKGVDTRAEDFSYGDYLRSEVVFWNKDIGNLYKQFTSKDSDDLKNHKNWQNIYFVRTSRTYFHEQPDDKTKQASYIIRGDAVYISEKKEGWVFANYLNPTQKTSSGWIRLKDVMNLDD